MIAAVNRQTKLITTIAFDQGFMDLMLRRMTLRNPYGSFPFFLNQPWPILAGLVEIAFLVFVEAVADAFAVLHVELSIDDLKSFHLHGRQLVAGNTISTITAEQRLVFHGLLVKENLVLPGNELIGGSVRMTAKLRLTHHWLVVRKKCHGIVALDSDAGLIEIQQCFGLSGDAKGESHRQQECRYLFHLDVGRGAWQILTTISLTRTELFRGI